MKSRNYLVVAATFWAACGSSENVEIDAASLGDRPPVAEAPIAPEANQAMDLVELTTDSSLAVDLEMDSWPAVDLEMGSFPGVDSPPAMDTSPPYDASWDATIGNDGATEVACNPEVLGTTPPALLSQTGCFEPGKPGQPIAAFFQYEVNSPLWSDGAVKSRFLMVPAGMTINVKDCDQDPTLCLPIGQGGAPEDEGHFDLPIDSILIKNFRLQDKLIETRLLIRMSASLWTRYSYEWNEEATEANLLSDSKDRTVGTQVWHYPSQQECIQCHTAAAGRSLGLTTRQLDRVTSDGNQLDRMVAMGLLPTRPKALAPYPDPRKPGPVEDRARAYLQTNCSFCHRPAGPFSDMDMRYVTALIDMNLCGVPTVRGAIDPNVPLTRLVPGEPTASAVSVRMHNRSGYAMPKLGSNLVDPEGMAVVDQWIREITSCPTSR